MTDASATALADALRDRYEIERELGRGGMATVFLAIDRQHRRHVALKVLRPELAQTLVAGRFLREVEVTARLQHPHILPVFDSGQAAGSLWYTMPYVEGKSLRDLLQREGPLPIPTALRIAREVAGALDYAHRHGVVHRDIKPENILLSDQQALVADLGIAKALTREGDTTLTEVGMSLGTPAYMSPEQVLGETLDGRSDTYSLACVTFEMLTGEPPHPGRNLQAIVARRLTEPTPSIRARRDGVSAATEEVVQRALATDPADRFPTTGAFAEALDAATGAPSASRTRSRGVKPFTVRLAVAGLTVAGVALAWWATNRSASDTGPSSAPAGQVSDPAPSGTAAPGSGTAPTLTDSASKQPPPVAGLPASSPPNAAAKTQAQSPLTDSARVSARDSSADARRCTRLLERVSLGEELTQADSAFLRRRCRGGSL